jgi:hypothetical protein
MLLPDLELPDVPLPDLVLPELALAKLVLTDMLLHELAAEWDAFHCVLALVPGSEGRREAGDRERRPLPVTSSFALLLAARRSWNTLTESLLECSEILAGLQALGEATASVVGGADRDGADPAANDGHDLPILGGT